MPHSSGGGSHGGGSHYSGGGHSSHGGYSGGGGDDFISFTNTRVSRKPYRFCSTYCYYVNKKPVYFYADFSAKDFKQSAGELVLKIVIWLLVCPMFFITSIWMFKGSIKTPKKLTGNYDTEIIIEDNINVISKSEEKELKSVLKEFYKETGIVPAVVTVNNEEWRTTGNLEGYAYKDYLDRFKDEKHWLIVYSEPEDPDPSFVDWYWEGMQGNDTDDILTSKKTKAFTDDLQKDLLKEKTSVGEALIASFEEITGKAMKTDVNIGLMLFSFVPAGIGVLLTIYFFDIHPIRKAMLKKAIRVSTNSTLPKEQTCRFCGGIYVVGCHLECPHCGGALEPHDYTVDAQGNVKEVLH